MFIRFTMVYDTTRIVIKITKENADKLKKLGSMGDSYNDVIGRLIEANK